MRASRTLSPSLALRSRAAPFDLTYTDANTTNQVEAVGNFTTDGKTLTVTKWTLTGPCGPDSGTGVLTRQ